jgi:hypothetical protein
MLCSHDSQSPLAHADLAIPCGAAGAMASLTPQNGRATLPQEVASVARPMESGAKRPRNSIDVPPQIRRRLRLAAAKRDLTIRRYVLQAIEHASGRTSVMMPRRSEA